MCVCVCVCVTMCVCVLQSPQEPLDRDAEDTKPDRGGETVEQAVHALLCDPERFDCGRPAADRGACSQCWPTSPKGLAVMLCLAGNSVDSYQFVLCY